jgi:hypothetical protein
MQGALHQAKPRPKGGRPKHADRQSDRRRHCACLALRRLCGWTARDVAQQAGVTRRTVFLWSEWARNYPECATDAKLREFLDPTPTPLL